MKGIPTMMEIKLVNTGFLAMISGLGYRLQTIYQKALEITIQAGYELQFLDDY